MNTPLKLVWKFDSCLDLNTPWIWTETWFKQASSWVKTKIWWWKCDYQAEISYVVDISLPEMFTFVTSCCSPHISTSQQKSSTECLIWCCSGCVRILPFDTLRELCHSTVSVCVWSAELSDYSLLELSRNGGTFSTLATCTVKDIARPQAESQSWNLHKSLSICINWLEQLGIYQISIFL